ncbi:NFACT RNA binding domain-containing protein [soil metagenome]
MHNNYYFLRQLTRTLELKIQGKEFLSCFSQNKNELILGFADNDKEFFIRASLNPDFCCLSFPSTFARSRINNINIFTMSLQSHVVKVEQYLNERSFAIHLENEFSLKFKMHGNRSNIILSKGNEIISIFRNNLKKDWQIIPENLHRPLTQDLKAFEEADCKTESLFPTFGPRIKEYLMQQNFSGKDCEQKWQTVQQILAWLNSSEYFLTYFSGQPVLSLIPFGEIQENFIDPLEAIKKFYQTYTGTYYLTKEKNEIKKNLEKRHVHSVNYLTKSRNKLKELKFSSRYEELANILMANLHNIQHQATEVELWDFYKESPIKLKIKRDETPQKAAENLYRKGKNQKLEVEQLERNIAAKENAVNEIEHQIKEINEIADIKTLRKYLKGKNIIHNADQQEEIKPYKKLDFEGYEILVGKNAKSNDLLIQKFAKKDDLWLHAKDSSGSHVIIKNKPGQNFPKKVLEKAAEVAAYHSKQKNNTLCPVIYTSRKYVRKVKGGAPGAVMVDKESIILVKPAI